MTQQEIEQAAHIIETWSQIIHDLDDDGLRALRGVARDESRKVHDIRIKDEFYRRLQVECKNEMSRRGLDM